MSKKQHLRLSGYNKLAQLEFLFILCASYFVTTIQGTHFRGGTVWWGPSQYFSDTSKEIQVEYQLGWKVHISTSTDVTCDDESIKNRNITGSLGEWKIGSDAISEVKIVCAEYDAESDWMIGYNQFYYNVTTNNFTSWYQGRCWVGELYYSGCDWSLSFMANVGIRSDTGKPNSSPKSASIPIIRMQVGCPITIKIPTTDPDGDDVTCRFGQDFQECGSVCQHFPFFAINEELCELTYNGGGLEATVTVAIIIEDHPHDAISVDEGSTSTSISPSDRLSYVSLQFLVSLTSSSNPCIAIPTFTEDTPPDGQVVTTVTGAVQKLQVFAKASAPTENITDISFVYPLGTSKSALEKLADNVFSINVTWIPTAEQVGMNLICFLARDTLGLSTLQRCITVVVGGASSPCSINNGGCSDNCISISSASYFCNCPRKCWYLDADGRTCKPNLQVECNDDTMKVMVPTCAVDIPELTVGYDISASSAVPDECEPVSDDQFHNFTLGFSQCQMRVWESFWEITYTNVVRLWAEQVTDNGTVILNPIITRGAWYLVPISCSFSKFGNLTASFQPVDRQVELLSVPGMGSFSFFLDFYNSSSFDQANGPYDYPLTFTVNSDIYFGLRAVGGGTNMEIFTINCIAFPNADDDSQSYSMINNGCILDNTMVQYPSSARMENHFSIKAFKFRDTFPSPDGTTTVYIRCSVMVCTNGLSDEITRCAEGCVDTSTLSRKKRSIQPYRYKRQLVDGDEDDDNLLNINSSITESPVQQVASSGDIKILVDVNIETGTDEPPSSATEIPAVILVASGVVGLGCLFLIAICCVVVYHNKYVHPRNMILPEECQQHTAAYVRNVFLPNLDLEFDRSNPVHTQLPMRGSVNEFVWSRRIINGPSDDIFANFPPYKNGW